VFLSDVYQHQSAAGYVQILQALECLLLEMLNWADRPTADQVYRFDRLYITAVQQRYSDITE